MGKTFSMFVLSNWLPVFNVCTQYNQKPHGQGEQGASLIRNCPIFGNFNASSENLAVGITEKVKQFLSEMIIFSCLDGM